MTISKFAAVVVLVALFSVSTFAQILTPQGRLTLTSNTPVMTTDVANATTIYYASYVGSNIPVFESGVATNATMSSQLSFALSSVCHTTGNIYDLYAEYVGGSTPIILLISPAWTSSTSRGTGAPLVAFYNGILTNSQGWNASSDGCILGVPAHNATYLGSFYITSSGQTSVVVKPSAASGGNGNYIGLYNAFNRVDVSALSRDSNFPWTDSNSTSWEAADSSNNNRIWWLDGLKQTPVKARYQVLFETSANNIAAQVGVNLNSYTATPNVQGAETVPTATNFNAQIESEENFPAQLGLNYVQAMEIVSSGTVSFFGSPFQSLILDTQF